MTGKRYVLFGCPVDKPKRYSDKGYIGVLQTGDIGLVSDGVDSLIPKNAKVYVDDKEPGHGTPDDWAKLFREDYGLNVHPVFLGS